MRRMKGGVDMNYKKFGVFAVFALLLFGTTLALVSAEEEKSGWDEISDSSFVQGFRYIFGEIPAGVSDNNISAAIVTIAVWVLIVITFGDIIAMFGTFSKWVAWGIGLIVGVIVANIGINVKIIAGLTSIFAWLGTIAIYAGLITAFVAFFAVNFGIASAKGWLERRKQLEKAATGKTKITSGIDVAKAIGTEAAKGE